MKRCSTENNWKQSTSYVSVNGVLFTLFLLALLYPPFVSEELLQVKLLATSANFIAFISGAALLLINNERITFDLFFLVLLCLSAVMILSTVLNSGQVFSAVSMCVKYLLLYLVISVMYRASYESMVQILAGIFAIYILFNLFSWAYISELYPEGFRDGDFVNMWFLGNKNTIRNYVLPGLTFMLIWELCIKKRTPVLSILLFIISIISLVLVNSVTPTMVVTCIGVLFVFAHNEKIRLTAKGAVGVFFVIMLAVFLAPIVLSDGTSFQLLNRDLTYSGRTYIWQQAVESIGNYPFFGTGLQDLENQGLLDRGDFRHVNHAHNALLDMQFKYGIFALVLSFALLAIAVKSASSMDKKRRTIMLCAILAFLLCGLFGELSNEMFVIILAFAAQGKIDISISNERRVQHVA